MTPRSLTAAGGEFLGTAFLLAGIVGSGIMAQRLSAGNGALALLANAVATGALLVVLIHVFTPVSGAHFNPAVSLAEAVEGRLSPLETLRYGLAQTAGAVAGVLLAHAMFGLPLLQASGRAREGFGQGLSEGVATFGLVFLILRRFSFPKDGIPWLVGLYILSAYWFTASTSFANPAVTLARSLTDTFSGIRPQDAPIFLFAQALGTIAALALHRILQGSQPLHG